MDIVWLGHSCFRLRGKEVTIVTDPFSPELGYPWPRPAAQIVTVSHPHLGHSYVQGVEGQPRILSGPGEYEVAGVFILGFPSYHDSEGGKRLGKNTIYLMEIDGVKVCHLGDLGHPLSAQLVQEVGHADVLLLPVGGSSSINAVAAAQVLRQLEPQIAIPMHYRTEMGDNDLEPVDRFVQEMGLKLEPPLPRLSVTRSGLRGEDRAKVVVLNNVR